MSRYLKEGDIVGRLTIIKNERRPLKSSSLNATESGWICACKCGNTKWVRHHALIKSNPTKSCGCLQVEQLKNRSITHGKSGHPLYKVWQGMKNRCLYTNNKKYKNYGGRGVKICEKWMNYSNFYNDNYMYYKPHLSLDRIDNDGDYTPENTRWTTNREQARNTRKNVFLTHSGKTQTLIAWAEELGINYHTLCKRNKTGKPINQVLHVGKLIKSTPPCIPDELLIKPLSLILLGV